MIPVETSPTPAGGRIGAAIASASRRTGVDFTYLMGQARLESSFNPAARARTSSASGLYQFIDATWLAVVDRHGAQHGLGWAADAIQRGADGRLRVADAGMRRQIMDLRYQPEAAAAMAGEFAADNGRYLEGRLGRAAASVDLYLAHFLGPAGAARFLARHDADPNAPAAPEFGRQAAANRSIFFDRSGAPRSYADIRARFERKLGAGDGGAVPPVSPVPVSSDRGFGRIGSYAELQAALRAAPAAPPSASRDAPRAADAGMMHARLAYLMLSRLDA